MKNANINRSMISKDTIRISFSLFYTILSSKKWSQRSRFRCLIISFFKKLHYCHFTTVQEVNSERNRSLELPETLIKGISKLSCFSLKVSKVLVPWRKLKYFRELELFRIIWMYLTELLFCDKRKFKQINMA